VRRINLAFAEHCAWRAVYLYILGDQIAHLGIDPTASGGPQIFGAFYFVGPRPWRWRRLWPLQSFLFRFTSFRFKVPHIRWQYRMPAWKLAIYQRQQALLYRIDGRFTRQTTVVGSRKAVR